MSNYIFAFNSKQVAYPVGIYQDAYYINSMFKQYIDSEIIEVEHSVIKNAMADTFNPQCKYKEGTRFREILFVGSYKECQLFITNIVINQ